MYLDSRKLSVNMIKERLPLHVIVISYNDYIGIYSSTPVYMSIYANYNNKYVFRFSAPNMQHPYTQSVEGHNVLALTSVS